MITTQTMVCTVSGVSEHRIIATVQECEEQILVGTVGVLIHGEVARLRQLYVAPLHRRKRIGSVLIASAVRTAQEAGCESLALVLSAVDADAALPFYRRKGFVTAELYADGDRTLVMALNIHGIVV